VGAVTTADANGLRIARISRLSMSGTGKLDDAFRRTARLYAEARERSLLRDRSRR
jgi:hypothetical protein